MSKATRITLIICAAVIIITVAVLSYLSGTPITLGESLQALGLFVGGILAALGLRRGAGLLLVLAISTSQMACFGQPWLAARGTIVGAQAALEAVEPTIPADADGRDEALDITRSALSMGELAVDMWEEEASSDKPIGWWKWAGAAARGFTLVLDILKRAGVPIPAALSMAAAAIAVMVPT